MYITGDRLKLARFHNVQELFNYFWGELKYIYIIVPRKILITLIIFRSFSSCSHRTVLNIKYEMFSLLRTLD